MVFQEYKNLFEARNPKGKATLSEIDGRIEILPTKKKQMRVVNVRSLENPEEFKAIFNSYGRTFSCY